MTPLRALLIGLLVAAVIGIGEWLTKIDLDPLNAGFAAATGYLFGVILWPERSGT